GHADRAGVNDRTGADRVRERRLDRRASVRALHVDDATARARRRRRRDLVSGWRARKRAAATDAEKLLRAAATGREIDDQELRARAGRLEVHALDGEAVRSDAAGPRAGGDVDRGTARRQRKLERARADVANEVDAPVLKAGERRLAVLRERVHRLVPVG